MLQLTHNVLTLFFTINSEAYVTVKGRFSGTFTIILCTLVYYTYKIQSSSQAIAISLL